MNGVPGCHRSQSLKRCLFQYYINIYTVLYRIIPLYSVHCQYSDPGCAGRHSGEAEGNVDQQPWHTVEYRRNHVLMYCIYHFPRGQDEAMGRGENRFPASKRERLPNSNLNMPVQCSACCSAHKHTSRIKSPKSDKLVAQTHIYRLCY